MSLDDDIAAWAATVRLTGTDADAIFARIVRVPAATAAATLAPSWWRDFNAGFAARMVASIRLAA